ncbi:MAG TPA: 4a-hydroxytetrahydrobiopterin dehydratase [Candidatus Peribacteraceae bacterium]|nr:4a-hydroxytetrahydrobiopterin dehydratase [Candidatus Peribacteraceae bacterium]
MSSLTHKKCVPCEGGVPTLTPEEVEKFIGEVPEWNVNEEATQIYRTFKFRDFVQAMIFVNAVAQLAEDEGHHPDFQINYGKVTLTLWTHAIGGLSENDFILAAKIDQLPESFGETVKGDEEFLAG